MGFFRKRKPETNYQKNIFSQNGRVVCSVIIQSGHVGYFVSKNGMLVINKSGLGFELQGEKSLGSNLAVVRTKESSFDETWETLWGEERYIRNNYNELALYLAEVKDEKRLFTLRFRVFDNGVAFRYEIPPQPKFSRITILNELTEFNVDASSQAWQIPAYQPDRYEYNYEKTPVYELVNSVHTPLTMQVPTVYFVSIHEAALYDYGSMTLKLNEWHALHSDITPLSGGARAYVNLPFNTPWRVIMIEDRAIDLVNNRIMLNLNEPPKTDFSWVKPLKFMGIWWAMYVGEWTWAPGERHGATTEHAFEYIDACKKLGIGGLLIEGWNNGWDGDWLQNGMYNDFTKPAEDFRLPEVAKYARQNGVELVGHHETVGFVDNYERQIEQAYKYYADNGIHYVKPGYAGSSMVIQGRKEFHHSQVGVRHYQRAVELAAKYHIMLDVHEPIKGTGTERTWPNLMTREGARGQEYEGGALSPSHGCILPFTRLLAGGMDYTSGVFDVTNGTKRIASTLARQLAYYVTIFSGMQMAADRPRFYEIDYPKVFKFIQDVPVTWGETLPLLGEIGQYYAVARKSRENDWYIGGVTNEDGRRMRITLDFLGDGEYLAEIYRDSDDAHYRDNQLGIVVETRVVSKNDYFDFWVAPGGGFAVRLKSYSA